MFRCIRNCSPKVVRVLRHDRAVIAMGMGDDGVIRGTRAKDGNRRDDIVSARAQAGYEFAAGAVLIEEKAHGASGRARSGGVLRQLRRR